MNTWVLNFANTIVGVGVLAIPFCFHVCGIGIAVLMILATNVITRKTCEYLLKAGQLTRKSGYESLAQHHLGPLGKLVTEIGIIGLMLGTLISFQVVIGDLSPGLISNALGIQETWSLRTMLMCFSALGVVPLSLMRNISSLANMNAMSMGFYCIFIFVVFIMSLRNLFSGLWTLHVNFWRPEGFFHCLPIISLSFSCQSQVFVMYEAIPEQSVNIMMDIINKAIHMVTVMYLLVGTFGYIAFYEGGIRGDILANFPSGILADAIKTGFWVSVIVSFPLIIFPLRMSLYSLFFADNKSQGQQLVASAPGYIPQDKFNILTLMIVIGTLIIGILIPHIETVLSITGAVVGTFLCFIFPAALFILSTSKENGSRKTAKAIFVLGIICLVASTLAVLSANDVHMDTEHKAHPGHEDNPVDEKIVARVAKPFQIPGDLDVKGPDKVSGNIDRGRDAAIHQEDKVPLVNAKPLEKVNKNQLKKVAATKKVEESRLDAQKNLESHKGVEKKIANEEKVNEKVEGGIIAATVLPVRAAEAQEERNLNPLSEAVLVKEKNEEDGKDDANRIKSREIKTLNEAQEVVAKKLAPISENTVVNASSTAATNPGIELKETEKVATNKIESSDNKTS